MSLAFPTPERSPRLHPVGVGETGLAPGTFEATVAGDLTLDLAGTAVFQTVGQPGQELHAHVIQLIPSDQAAAGASWLMIATESPQPPEGTFPVVEITEQDLDQAEPAAFLDAIRGGFAYLGFFGEAEEWTAFVLSRAREITVWRTDDGGKGPSRPRPRGAYSTLWGRRRRCSRWRSPASSTRFPERSICRCDPSTGAEGRGAPETVGFPAG